MSDKEIATFNVKNVSLRIVGFAGEILAPTEVIRVVDDEKGINRKSVERDPFLDETDEKPTKESILDISVKPESDSEPEAVEKHVAPKVVGTNKPATKSEGKTATGAGWKKA